MSSAFVKEGDAQWLHDVSPTLAALQLFLTSENNGVRVYQKRHFHDAAKGLEVFEMSNGLCYSKDRDGRWEIIW